MRQRDKNRRKSAVFSLCAGGIALSTLQSLCILLFLLAYFLPVLYPNRSLDADCGVTQIGHQILIAI